MKLPNLYEFLGVPRDAAKAQIDKAYREKARELHPDKNKVDPEAVNKFALLNKAYQILTDANKRKAYDATLPVLPKEPEFITEPGALWKATAEKYFQIAERFTPAVDALRISIPLALEEQDGLLVVGIEPAKSNLVGYVETSDVRNKVRRILSDFYGKPLNFRIITGTNPQDWTQLKDAEEKIRIRKAQGQQGSSESNGAPLATGNGAVAAPVTASGENWDELIENISRAWTAVELRSSPQNRARFVLDQLPVISRQEDASRAQGMPEEQLQRSMARAFERVGSLANIENGVVALEYLRYRRLIGG